MKLKRCKNGRYQKINAAGKNLGFASADEVKRIRAANKKKKPAAKKPKAKKAPAKKKPAAKKPKAKKAPAKKKSSTSSPKKKPSAKKSTRKKPATPAAWGISLSR